MHVLSDIHPLNGKNIFWLGCTCFSETWYNNTAYCQNELLLLMNSLFQTYAYAFEYSNYLNVSILPLSDNMGCNMEWYCLSKIPECILICRCI